MATTKIISAYCVIVIFSFAALILIYTICKLMIEARKNKKKKGSVKEKKLRVLVNITIIGIISFLAAVLLMIFVILQIVLIDGHALHPDTNPLHDFYYQSFEEMEYFIAIFDAFGHLAVLSIFVIRLQICFENSVFGYSKRLIKAINICLISLTLLSIVIIFEIIRDDQDVYVIIISEIIWELLIEAMMIYLLYLFIAKLYTILKMSLQSCNTNQIKPKSDLDLFKDLKRNIKESQSSKSDERKKRKQKLDDTNKNKQGKKTINKLHIHPTPNAMPKPQHQVTSSYNMEVITPTDQMTIGEKDDPLSFTMSATHIPPSMATKQSSAQLNTKSSTSNNVLSIPPNNNNNNVANYDVDLVNVMNKMTLLVVITVIGSILSVIGNIFVEIHELETIAKHTVDVQSMWAFLLPVIDMVVTSFALYLQFNFTEKTYSSICTKLDISFLTLCLKINAYRLVKSGSSKNESPIKEQKITKQETEKDISLKPEMKKLPSLRKDASSSLLETDSNPMRNGTWTCSVNQVSVNI